MIIKNITIENFRSYYGTVSINTGDGLTLMIGANGEGKTTLFEALEWLFDTSGILPKVDTKFISKKKLAVGVECDVYMMLFSKPQISFPVYTSWWQ